MATYTVCDLCDKRINWGKDFKLEVEFSDGEHPHCGSRMTKNADVCSTCIRKIEGLRVHKEFDEVTREVREFGD